MNFSGYRHSGPYGQPNGSGLPGEDGRPGSYGGSRGFAGAGNPYGYGSPQTSAGFHGREVPDGQGVPDDLKSPYASADQQGHGGFGWPRDQAAQEFQQAQSFRHQHSGMHGGPGGYGQQGGDGFGRPHGSAGEGSNGSNGSGGSNARLIAGGIGVVALVAVLCFAAWSFLGGSENSDKAEVADSANRTVGAIVGSDKLSDWNRLLCDQYRAKEDSMLMVDDTFGHFGRNAFDLWNANDSFDESSVTFTDDSRTVAEVGQNGDTIRMIKENGEWKICDSEIDFTVFDGFAGAADIFGGLS